MNLGGTESKSAGESLSYSGTLSKTSTLDSNCNTGSKSIEIDSSTGSKSILGDYETNTCSGLRDTSNLAGIFGKLPPNSPAQYSYSWK